MDSITPKNCDISVKKAIQQLKTAIKYDKDKTFGEITITGLAASRLIASDASKKLVSSDLASWVGGTANQITVTDDADGTVTLSLPSALAVPGKVTAGSFASPTDVTNTRQYGFELHYSGNDYDVTGIRSRARLKTTDTTATAQGALLQAANEDGINAGVLNGALIEAIGKSDANAATIAVMRGSLINTEWGDYDTVTNLKTLHVRTHSRNAAGAGSFGTGYGIYIENEAVGGNGQAYDAGIYFKDTNISGGNKAFTYGIDFSGGTYSSEEIKLANGSVIGSDSVVLAPTTDSTTFFQILDADGGTPIFNVDTVNERGGFGTASPNERLHLYQNVNNVAVSILVENADNADASYKLKTRDVEAEIQLDNSGILIFIPPATGYCTMSTNTGSSPFSFTRVGSINQALLMWVDDTSAYLLSEQDEDSAGYGNIIFRADDDGSADGYFAFQGKSGTEYARILGITGYVGFGETIPETLTEWTSTAPYLTLHNSTHEDTDGGGESRLIFKREDGAGTETACFQFEASHDGSGANDQLGKGVWSVNTGAELVQALEIGSDLLATFAGAVSITGAVSAGSFTGLVIGTDIQAHGDVLDDLNTLGAVGADSEFLVGTAAGALAWEAAATAKASIGLGNVENTQLSTWAGTTNITTLGTIASVLSFGQSIGVISSDTSDASDTKAIRLAGGGAGGSIRGAEIIVKGNEYSTTGGALYIGAGNVNSTGVIELYTAVTRRLMVTYAGKVDIGAAIPVTKLTVEGTITLKEQAAADGDTAAYMQIWAKTATPNELWATNDAGTDFQLGGPTGSMILWTTDTAPSGWLLCYGQAISRSTYASLYAVISTTFGVGDGSTTFNLPDLRGRFPLGQDDMGGSSANRVTHAQADSIGGVEGEETHTLIEAEMPAHIHTFTRCDSGTGYAEVLNAGPNNPSSTNTNSTGGDGAHNNMPPYITLNYIIRY